MQAFRAVLTWVSDQSAWRGGRAMLRSPPPGLDLPHAPNLAAHAATTPVVMLDATGWLNLLVGVPAPLWTLVQRTAKQTLALLSGVGAQSGVLFRHLFPPTGSALAAFDAEAVVRLGQKQAVAALVAGDLAAPSAAAAIAERLLTRALTERATLVVVAPPLPAPVPLRALSVRGLPGLADELCIHVGLLLDGKQVRESCPAPACTCRTRPQRRRRKLINQLNSHVALCPPMRCGCLHEHSCAAQAMKTDQPTELAC